jgi:hypothetical protein
VYTCTRFTCVTRVTRFTKRTRHTGYTGHTGYWLAPTQHIDCFKSIMTTTLRTISLKLFFLVAASLLVSANGTGCGNGCNCRPENSCTSGQKVCKWLPITTTVGDKTTTSIECRAIPDGPNCDNVFPDAATEVCPGDYCEVGGIDVCHECGDAGGNACLRGVINGIKEWLCQEGLELDDSGFGLPLCIYH